MDVEDVIRDFATTGHRLPRDSIRFCHEHWTEAGPRFVALLDSYAGEADLSDEIADALFFIIHLLGEKNEKSAFVPLCRLLHDEYATERVLGDAIGETLKGILISTYDGQIDHLIGLIESVEANEIVRAEALLVMAYFVRMQAISEDRMRSYMLELLPRLQPQDTSYVWSGWAMAASHLGYEDFGEHVRMLCERKFIGHHDMNYKDFIRDLDRTLADPERMASFEFDRLQPFTDTIGVLSRWYYFSKEYAESVEREERRERRQGDEGRKINVELTHRDPMRHVGRNDLCPCGSGKKYKKCCLGSAGAVSGEANLP